MQSPIDIETEDTLLDTEFGRNPLEVHYHLQAAHGVGADHEEGVDEIWTLVNTGATLRVNITNSQSCKLLPFTLLQGRLLMGGGLGDGSPTISKMGGGLPRKDYTESAFRA